MGARGPKSATELSVVPREDHPADSSRLQTIDRPNPPASLTTAEAEEWRRVVNGMPADWLSPGFDVMLEGHCRHVVIERRESQIIDQILSAEEFDEAAYSRAVTRMQNASRYLASVAVRLGWAQSTSYENKKPKGGKAKKPWQFD